MTTTHLRRLDDVEYYRRLHALREGQDWPPDPITQLLARIAALLGQACALPEDHPDRAALLQRLLDARARAEAHRMKQSRLETRPGAGSFCYVEPADELERQQAADRIEAALPWDQLDGLRQAGDTEAA